MKTDLVYRRWTGLLAGVFAVLLTACAGSKKQPDPASFDYVRFRDSLLRGNQTDTSADSTNIFDNAVFIPGKDSLEWMLGRMDTLWKEEEHLVARLDSLRKKLRPDPGYTEEERTVIRENIREVDTFLLARDTVLTGRCHGPDCILFVQIDKARQRLYLDILGLRRDTFKISTGKGKKYETPEMELNPLGPVLTKYTSRKFPGGNYAGLGNMPYAVFLKNGYAIHGTTPGNFSKLGSRASHGCIRLHPDNAKIFNALVKTIGLKQTWVSVRDSLP